MAEQKTDQALLSAVENLAQSAQNVADLLHQLLDEQKRLRAEQERLSAELEYVKSRIILSEDNANRNGRPRALSDEDIAWLVEQRKAGRSVTDLAHEFAVTRQTVYRILKWAYAKQAESTKASRQG